MRIDDGLSPLVELAASRHNAFHTTEAAEIDITSRRLRRARETGVLHNLHPKVWAFAALPTSQAQAIRGATLALSSSAAAFGSAAWLHGWIEAPPTQPQLWMPSTGRPRLKGVTAHQMSNICPDIDIVQVDRVRTLNKAATLCLAGSTLPRLLVEKCLDEFLRTESERWLDQTLDRLRTPTSKGPRLLDKIRSDPSRLVGVTDSWLERITAKLVNLAWMPPLVLQHSVAAGDRLFRIDLACPDLMLGIETHSRTFHFGASKEDADNVRDLLLAVAGWKLIYVTYSQLLKPDEFVRHFAQAARARAAQLGVPV